MAEQAGVMIRTAIQALLGRTRAWQTACSRCMTRWTSANKDCAGELMGGDAAAAGGEHQALTAS